MNHEKYQPCHFLLGTFFDIMGFLPPEKINTAMGFATDVHTHLGCSAQLKCLRYPTRK